MTVETNEDNRVTTMYEEKSKEAFDQIVVIKNNIKQIEENILDYQSEILDFHKKVYEGSEDNPSWEEYFENLQQKFEENQVKNAAILAQYEKDIADVQEKYEKLASDIEATHQKIFKPLDGETLSIDQKVNVLYEEIEKKNSEFEGIILEVKDEQKELLTFKNEMLGTFTAEGNIKEEGLQQRLTDLENELHVFDELQKTKIDELKNKIESLLPGATSAGLAFSYKTAKDEYATKISKTTCRFNLGIGLLFVVALVIIIWDACNKPDISTVNSFLVYLSYRLLLISPIVWFTSYNALQNRHLFRLQEEYAHKKAIAESYEGFKRQVEKIDAIDEETTMLKDLLSSTINAIAFKASDVLDKKHKDVLGPYEKIFENASNFKVKNGD